MYFEHVIKIPTKLETEKELKTISVNSIYLIYLIAYFLPI